MDLTTIEAASQAFGIMLEPMRLLFLAAGVILGIVIGILPGIGGLAGTALLLPFTYSMDSYTALAFLLGLGAATATGDPIPAILFGVPGGVGSAATVQDGFAMAKKGQAGRALSRLLQRLADRRRVRRAAAGRGHPGHPAIHAACRLARTAGIRHFRHFHGRRRFRAGRRCAG